MTDPACAGNEITSSSIVSQFAEADGSRWVWKAKAILYVPKAYSVFVAKRTFRYGSTDSVLNNSKVVTEETYWFQVLANEWMPSLRLCRYFRMIHYFDKGSGSASELHNLPFSYGINTTSPNPKNWVIEPYWALWVLRPGELTTIYISKARAFAKACHPSLSATSALAYSHAVLKRTGNRSDALLKASHRFAYLRNYRK